MMRSARFGKGMADDMRSLNASIGFDKRFWREDIEGSKAWARGLLDSGILSAEELEEICGGLDKVAAEIESGEFNFSEELEDILEGVAPAGTTPLDIAKANDNAAVVTLLEG